MEDLAEMEDRTMEDLTTELALASIALRTKIQVVQQKAAQLAGEDKEHAEALKAKDSDHAGAIKAKDTEHASVLKAKDSDHAGAIKAKDTEHASVLKALREEHAGHAGSTQAMVVAEDNGGTDALGTDMDLDTTDSSALETNEQHANFGESETRMTDYVTALLERHVSEELLEAAKAKWVSEMKQAAQDKVHFTHFLDSLHTAITPGRAGKSDTQLQLVCNHSNLLLSNGHQLVGVVFVIAGNVRTVDRQSPG
jgi:hypothetical protein